MSNLHGSIVKTCFSLAKYNNGLFKSEKQAKFLSQLGNILESVQNHTLGYEYNNKFCGQTFWTIQLDDQGVTQITKSNSKGTVTHFQREEQASFENKQTMINQYKMLAEETNNKYNKALDRFHSLNELVKGSHVNTILKAMDSSEFKALTQEQQTVKIQAIASKVKAMQDKAQRQIDRLEKKKDFYNGLSDKYYYMVRQGIKKGASL